MGIKESSLQKAITALVGFDGKESKVTCTITLSVMARSRIDDEFNYAKAPSMYILGSPWRYQMKEVPSTYHQMIKLLASGEIAKISMD